GVLVLLERNVIAGGQAQFQDAVVGNVTGLGVKIRQLAARRFVAVHDQSDLVRLKRQRRSAGQEQQEDNGKKNAIGKSKIAHQKPNATANGLISKAANKNQRRWYRPTAYSLSMNARGAILDFGSRILD